MIIKKKQETRGRKKILTTKQRLKNDQVYRDNWRREHTKIINMRFNTETDKDVLNMLENVPNKADYIRRLILQDIEKEKEDH